MEQEVNFKISEYFTMASNTKMNKEQFFRNLDNNYKEILLKRDLKYYFALKRSQKTRLILATLTGSAMSMYLSYSLNLSSLSTKKSITLISMAFFLPIYYVKIFNKSKTSVLYEEYLYAKYSLLQANKNLQEPLTDIS